MKPLVMLDEAHLLHREMLGEVRLHGLHEPYGAYPLRPVGAVGPVKLQTFATIWQQIDLVYRLSPFDRAQMESYVKKHLSAAGTKRDIFSKGAIDALYAYSGGIAPLINKVGKPLPDLRCTKNKSPLLMTIW